MAHLAILRSYAKKQPTDLPDSILFSHSKSNLTIYDAFPKSIFHFLLLPRFPADSEPSLSLADLSSLKSLLTCDKGRAKTVLDALNDDAKALRTVIESEMISRYGFKWPIQIGFHGAPSME
jgi:aprataxin